MNRKAIQGLSALLFLVICYGNHQALAQPPQYQYKILATEAHDPSCFTQGFELNGDWQYESCGMYGESKIVRYSRSGNNLPPQESYLSKNYFAEGLTAFDNLLFVLTWREGKAFVYNKDSLKQLKSFNYEGEGWGLTHNSEHLIMSDGSPTITFRNPQTFAIERSITVHSADKEWKRINELEYVDGVIWANQWWADLLLAIDENSGEVIAVVDISRLQKQAKTQSQSVANGIAYDHERQAFWITGKYWRYRYLLQFFEEE